MLANTLHKEVKKTIQDDIAMTVAADNQIYCRVDTMIVINMDAKKIHDLSHIIVNKEL